MDVITSAAIEVCANVLRYAEVHIRNHVPRLVRLGNCEFDFDLSDLGTLAIRDDRIETVKEAVSEIFAGSIAEQCNVVIHPPSAHSFFTPIQTDVTAESRQRQFRTETNLMWPEMSSPLMAAELLRPEVMDDGESINWYHVFVLDPARAKTMEKITAVMPTAKERFCASARGTAAVMKVIAKKEMMSDSAVKPYRLAAGIYPTHTEYTICRNQGWYYGHTTETSSAADAAYFSAALLDKLGIGLKELSNVYLYGDSEEIAGLDAFEAIHSARVVGLNPLDLVEHKMSTEGGEVVPAVYVPCIGATLRDM